MDMLSFLMGAQVASLHADDVEQGGIPLADGQGEWSWSNRLNEKGRQIVPIYLGDYMTPEDLLPSSVVRIGDYFYALDAPDREWAKEHQSNNGRILKFDIENNVEIVSARQSSVEVGHANSVAYDPVNGVVYVTPIWDSTSGAEVAYKVLLTFDTSMQSTGQEEIPTMPYAVSYDPVAHKLYYFDSSNDVYVKGESGWTLYTRINDGTDRTDPLNHGFGQDFAVYDGVFYLSSPYGQIGYGNLTPTTAAVSDVYHCIFSDSASRFHLGELEGFEFSASGHLYALMYSSVTTNRKNAFVVELPIGPARPHRTTNIQEGLFKYNDGTLELSEDTQARFALNTWDIRSLSQLEVRFLRSNSTRVTVPAGDTVIDDDNILVGDNFVFEISGTYQCRSMEIRGGHLNLQAGTSDGTLALTATSTPIYIRRAGMLTLGGQNALKISLPNGTSTLALNTFHIGYDYSLFIVRTLPTSVDGWTIGKDGSTLIQGAVYAGGLCVSRPSSRLNATMQYGEYIDQQAGATVSLHMITDKFGFMTVSFKLIKPLPQSEYVTIASFSSPPSASLVTTVPCIGNGTNVSLWVFTSGNVRLYTDDVMPQDTEAWYRATFPVMWK